MSEKSRKDSIRKNRRSTELIYWMIGLFLALVLLVFILWLIWKKGYLPQIKIFEIFKNLF